MMSASPNVLPSSPIPTASDHHANPPLFTIRQMTFASVFLGYAAPLFVAINWHRMRRNDLVIPTLAAGWLGGMLLPALVVAALGMIPMSRDLHTLTSEFAVLLVLPILNRYLVWRQEYAYEDWIAQGGVPHSFLTLGCFTYAIIGFAAGVILIAALTTILQNILTFLSGGSF